MKNTDIHIHIRIYTERETERDRQGERERERERERKRETARERERETLQSLCLGTLGPFRDHVGTFGPFRDHVQRHCQPERPSAPPSVGMELGAEPVTVPVCSQGC